MDQSVGWLCHPWAHGVVLLQLDSRLVGTGLEKNQKTHFREEAKKAWLIQSRNVNNGYGNEQGLENVCLKKQINTLR
jgi:hypothetical protein